MADQRVRWNSKEKALLSQRANEILAKEATSVLDALRKAQTVLPPKRRRSLLHVGQAPWFSPSRGQAPQSATMGAPSSVPMDWAGAAAAVSQRPGSNDMREALVEFFAGVIRDAMVRTGVPVGSNAESFTPEEPSKRSGRASAKRGAADERRTQRR